MKQCLSLCFGLMLASMHTYAQHEDKVQIAMPSPNNISSTQSYDVDYYSGRPKIGFPLYKLESDDLSIPIGIGYRASGVKLNDYASYVGMNWDLQTGGSVTRIVRGLPDESPKGYIGKNNVGASMNTGNHSDATRAGNIANGTWDGEPDLFTLTTPFESVSFVFDELKKPVFTQPSLMDIQLVRANGPDDDINIYWTATDSKGNSFTFGNSSLSRETVDGPPAYVSTWYLNSVKSFNSTDEITFLYITGGDITTTRYLKTKVVFNSGCGANPPDLISDYNTTTTFKFPKYLSQITGKQGKITFNYATDRRDLDGGRRLTSMDIYGEGTEFLKRIQFRHTYIQSVETNKDLNRLALKDVYVIGQDRISSIKLYEFKYFNNSAAKFPARNSVTFDHWGYYNNNTTATPFPPLAGKEPDLEKTKQFTLYEVEYGLGGKTTFTYELNSYVDQTTLLDKNAGGLRVKSISETDNTGNTLIKNFEYKLADGKSSGQHFLKSFVYNKNTTIFYSTCSITGESIYSSVLFGTNDLNGNAVGYSRVKVTNPDGGSEIYSFKNYSSNPDEFSILNASLGTTYSIDNFRQFGYPTSYAHRRGLLENKALYNAVGTKVSETSYLYAALSAEVRKSRGVSLTLEYNFATVSRWYQNVYYHVVDNYMLTKETNISYDMVTPTLSMTSETNYEYSTDGKYLRQITQTTSTADNSFQKYYYPVHRSEISGLSAEDNTAYGNMLGLAVPIREEKISVKANKDIVHHSYKAETTGGVTKVFPTQDLRSKNGSAFRVEATYGYNYFTGNLDVQNSRDGIARSFLYEPNGLVKAEIVNATTTEVFFEDFEQHPGAVAGSSHTGNKYYNTLPYQISFVRPNSRNYKLAYNRYVSGKWEYVLTDYTTDNLLLVGSYPIDNVKVFPEHANITSYNQIPLVGSSAKSLPNNNVTYYEYDEFQRMKVVRDRNRNVLNRYEYKTACDCPLPVVYASLEYQNYEIDDTRDDYYSESVEVTIVLKDANNNPVSVDALTVNMSEVVNTNGTIVNNDLSYVVTGSQLSLGRLIVNEQFLGPLGDPYSYTYTSYFAALGIGYLIW